ncbi:putative DnaJ like protein subfamily B member 11 [Bisporella sp. PMI_857]|nr:putative DnaJ like protein subfamily B member 11 [Bisporella sp. PMI_857]
MSDDNSQTQTPPLLQHKDTVIKELLHETDLYKTIGAPRTASAAELRRCYLERCQLVHPDKLPFHPDSTRAFQRLGFAFEVLKTPSSRRTYDRASKPSSSQLPDKTTFLGGEHTFRSAVAAVFQEFMTGDFRIVREYLESLRSIYPNLVSDERIILLENSLIKTRELILTTRTYALLVYIELGRIHKVSKRLMGLGYLDVFGRTKMTIHLARVTLAFPMRVDRALKLREERAWRAECAGLRARGITPPEKKPSAGILNEKISKVIEFIVGADGRDEIADEAWSSRMGGTAHPTAGATPA